MTILKHKRVRHFKFRDQRTHKVERPMSEPKRTYLATIDTTGVGAIALPADIDTADPSLIRKAIEQAEAEKIEETARLKHAFGLDKEPSP